MPPAPPRWLSTLTCAVLTVVSISLFVLFYKFPINVPSFAVSGVNGGKEIVRRGTESQDTDDMFWNVVGFGLLAMVSYALRMVNRGWVLGKFHYEDYFMSVIMIFYVVLMVFSNVSINYKTNLYPAHLEQWILADPQDVRDRIIGSKIGVALEQCMIIVLWGAKLCIWAFLLRVHRNLIKFENVLWVLFVYIWIGLFVVELLYLFVLCIPFEQYWALPVTNMECSTHHTYSIVQMIFNVSSDIGLIITPLPMIWGARLPMKRKFILSFIFCLASLTVITALMNKYFYFTSPLTAMNQIWSVREASIAITVANLICTWQLFQKIFGTRSFDNSRFSISDEASMPPPPGAIRFRSRLRRVRHRARGSTNALPTLNPVVKNEENDASVATGDTELEERGRWRDDERRNTQFSVMRDGDDAGPAILYRSMHNIA